MTTSPARDFRTELFPYEPRFARVRVAGQDVEMSYVEAGPADAAPIVLMHGNPTWSFLYRHIVPRLAERHRVIAPDLLGMGRSDKLDDIEAYSLANHLSAFGQLMDELELHDVTLAVHDWAGPIGLSWAVDHPRRLSGLVIQNTWAFTPKAHNKVPQPLKTFRTPVLGEGLVQGLNAFVNVALPLGVVHRSRMRGEIMRAYRAPHPDWRSRAPVLAFPKEIPLSPADRAYERMRRTDEGLRSLERPAIFLWGKQDPVFPPRVIRKFRERLQDVRGEVIFDDASHFLQEDRPEDIARHIADFMDGRRVGG